MLAKRWLVIAWLWAPALAQAQIFVQPTRAHRALVRHFDYDWRTIDLQVEPTDGGGKAGGVRLYFYEREREVAELAAGSLTESYRYLIRRFGFVPADLFPYILYNTYQEFLETNLFPLQEGVLGVTSPRDLTLTLPYFGDHELFRDVSTHELAHQFTIQKIRERARPVDLDAESLMGDLPLWFIEGLAEYYAHDGIDPEAEMVARDVVVNPNIEHGHGYLDLFAQHPMNVLWIYKMGQVRCAFLEEVYGEGTIQKVLDRTPELAGMNLDGSETEAVTFEELLERITGEVTTTIADRYEAWLKGRAFKGYLAAEQQPLKAEPLQGIRGHFDALASAPSGNALLYRAIDEETGQSRLTLVDPRDSRGGVEVATDGQPGVVSLHPVFGKNFDLNDDALVFVAQVDGNDVIYWQRFKHSARIREDAAERERKGEDTWDADLDLGERIAYDIGKVGLIAANAPALSPDGKRVAFVATERSGFQDLYLLTLGQSPDDFQLVRLTNDIWAEREVAWGPGALIFSADATPDGKFNLFAANPDAPGRTWQLTSEPRNHFDPDVLPDGRIVFVTYDDGHANVHELRDSVIVRRTGVPTGLFDVGPGPDGGLWAIEYHAGERRPVRIKKSALVEASESRALRLGLPHDLPYLRLEGDERYNSFAKENWHLDNIFGILGAGAGSIFGQVFATASDTLKNHAVLMYLSIYGRVELTDGAILYLNQERRLFYGGGAFQSLQFRVDRTVPELGSNFASGERFFGGLFTARHPFNTFQYIEGDFALGGVQHFLEPGTRAFLRDGEANGSGRDLLPEWRAKNSGTRFQTEATVRLGHDTIRYHRFTGPLSGSSALLQGAVASQPTVQAVFGHARLDLARHFAIYNSVNFFLRGASGSTFGNSRYVREFYLSSFETLRGVEFGDIDFLLGRRFFFGTAELQFPLDSILRIAFLPSVEGIAGMDFGAVADRWQDLWEKRVLDGVLGVNFVLTPLVLQLHFAKPIRIGAEPRKVGIDRGLPANRWVTNFSLNWLYL